MYIKDELRQFSQYKLSLYWTTGVRSPPQTKNFFSSLCVQTSYEAHSASYPMGIGVLTWS